MVGCLSHGPRGLRGYKEHRDSRNAHSTGQLTAPRSVDSTVRACVFFHPRVGQAVSGESLALKKRADLTADVPTLCFPSLSGPHGLS